MDITDRKAAEEQIRHLAHFDAVTELPNRHLFNQLLNHAWAKAGRYSSSLALLFVDLDGFKLVNDTLGHDAGDQVLVTFGKRLRECLRESDVAARLGGDEFVVLIENCGGFADIETVAQKILAAAAKVIRIGNEEARISASIGISVYPHDGKDVRHLTQHADQAMYRAKKAGKNCYRLFSTPREERHAVEGVY